MIAGGVGIAAVVGVIGSAIAKVVGGIAKTVSVETMKWLAFRAFMLFILYVALPILLYNILVGLLLDFIQYAITYVSDQDFSAMTIQLTGMGGWIAQQIQLPQAFSIFMSFLSIKFITRFIPFMK